MAKPLSLVALAFAAAAAIALTACSSPAAGETAATTTPVAAEAATDGTPITLTAGDVVITATLHDTRAAQDFAATLPATLSWDRAFGIEYGSEIPAPLTETGPFYTDVQPGDIVYYNPAERVTIIYKETSPVPPLTKMGEVTSDLSVFEDLPDKVEMTVELQ